MQFPQDGGLSCVRYYLAIRNSPLERFVQTQMQSIGRHVGTLVCQCNSDDCWVIHTFPENTHVLLHCGCNGSTLPVYIGEPPFEGRRADTEPTFSNSTVLRCACGTSANQVAIGIGYPGEIPKPGTLDVEHAVEVLIAGHCMGCETTDTRWHLTLTEPPVVSVDKPWIRIIQDFRFGSRKSN